MRTLIGPDFANRTASAGPRELPRELQLTVSADERARGQLLPENLRAAHVAFHRHGCLLLRDLFPLPLVEAMYQEFLARYGSLDPRGMDELAAGPMPNPIRPAGKGRFQISLRMSGAFCVPDVFKNPVLYRTLGPLLGADMQLNSLVIVMSYPGSSMQQIHRDYGHLFANEPSLGPNLPVFAVNCVVPLVDVDMQTGPTAVWPGSHRWPTGIEAELEAVTACPIRRGDCMLLDYRTLHTGLPNRSDRVRPILYLVYARGWFIDEGTYFGVNQPDIALEDYHRLPESAHSVLWRALGQAVRGREPGFDAGVKSDIPSRATDGGVRSPPPPSGKSDDPPRSGKVGRNDPCPCGSGRKYKQCHGALTA
jgi:Phytanoyl-CoA dioxygenase (PhyH)/SEC-C motif